jgi:hypothetical protein
VSKRVGANAYVVLAVAALASIATSAAPPGIVTEESDRLEFTDPQRIETRRVLVVVTPGGEDAHVTASVPIQVAPVNGKRPTGLQVIRESDGASVLDDYGPNYQPGSAGSVAGEFFVMDCTARQVTCRETFTFTFTRLREDARPTLAFSWAVNVRATYSVNASATDAPAGAKVEVTIDK